MKVYGFEDSTKVIVYQDVIVVMDVTGFAPAEIGSYEGMDLFMDLAFADCCDWFSEF